MGKREVLEEAKKIFPHFFEVGYTWFPLGKNVIRVHSVNGKTLFITYMGRDDWSIETPKRYDNRQKGG